jgi:uncharacterized protein YndB with AHSA1/START domain
MDDAELGTLTQTGDDCTVTFTRRSAHPVEKVWRAVTEPQHLKTWFPQEIRGELRTGASIRFVTDGDDGFDGEVLACEPPSLLELRWGTDRVRIELQPDGDVTVLTLSDTFAELGKAARDAAGWHECLSNLVAELEGTPRPADGETWKAVHPRYVDRFGPEAATIGPPGG